MNTNIQAILSSPFITEAQVLSSSAAAAQADLDALGQQVTALTARATSDETTIIELQDEVAALTKQLADAANVSVFDALELLPALVACGSVANSAGNPGVAGDAQGTPTDLNAFRDIFPNGAYQDKYWYWSLGADATKATFIYEGRLMLPNPTAPQCVELDVQQVIGGQCYNVGAQFDFSENIFRIWNRSPINHGWLSTGIPCPRWAANSWHSFKFEAHRDQSNVHYDAITIDGIRTPLTQSFPAIALNNPDCLNCAIQLDGNSSGSAYRLFIDGIRFTAK